MKDAFVRPSSGSNTLLSCCLLVAVSLIICCRAGAQAHQDGSPTVEVQENARVVVPDGTPPPVGVRHEPKALQNAAQQKQLRHPITQARIHRSRPH
jgi:hypothetical protein